jgi:hypothetical protein
MYSLIISCDGEDLVTVSNSIEKLESKALDFINQEIDINRVVWENFGNLEIEKVLLECIEIGDAYSAMELFADISDARGNICYIRITPAEIIMDA